MGALTLKNFPFELRGWDVDRFETLDPTDSFGSDTRAYVNNNQVIQIEPDYENYTLNTWLSDKGRQFFDSIFGTWNKENETIKKHKWANIFKTISQTLYTFDHCNLQNFQQHFFVIVIENLDLETFNLLLLIEQNYSFVKLRRSENFQINNNLEANFQINSATNKKKLFSSNLCLLISTNTRYEGSYLNLSLRQRYFKGNFKCLMLGSLIDLTFPVSFLGSNFSTIKFLTEGNHLLCQDLKLAENPILISNTETLKRPDTKNFVEILKYTNIITQTWNGLNILNSHVNEVGLNTLTKFAPLRLNDLVNFSSLYFINVTIQNVTNLKKLIELKLLKFSSNQKYSKNKLFLDQNYKTNCNLSIYFENLLLENKNLNNYLYLPNSMFFENHASFINTEGSIKRTTKLIFKKKAKNNWQILRKIFKTTKNLTFLNRKDNKIINFNCNNIYNFKNFIAFQFYATQTLNNISFYLTKKNSPFIIIKPKNTFKTNSTKFLNTKVKYWLDDFFSGGKDGYSHNSLTMTNCSSISRIQTTNFF